MGKLARALKGVIEKVKFRTKLKRMDDWWNYTGGSCFGLFPPSFYYTHTEEEVRRITDETLERLRSMIKELEDERTPQEKVNENLFGK